MEGIRQLQDRPLNILDLLFLEKYDGIPKRTADYIGAIGHPDFAEDFYKYVIRTSKTEAQRIEDILIQDNILYAIDKSNLYRKKYMKYMNINNPEELQSWVKNNINTGEDLELLPSLTNEDMRKQGLEHNAWWIPGKRIASTYQTGGSTGKPSIIPYSPIDKALAGLLMSSMMRKNADTSVIG